MGLRETAEADLVRIVEDRTTGFGWDIKLTNPSGVSRDLVGLSTDISALINPETGQAVSGRHATVALRMTTVNALGIGQPKGVPEENSRPWIVEFRDITNVPGVFKVYDVYPDRTLGLLILVVETYKK